MSAAVVGFLEVVEIGDDERVAAAGRGRDEEVFPDEALYGCLVVNAGESICLRLVAVGRYGAPLLGLERAALDDLLHEDDDGDEEQEESQEQANLQGVEGKEIAEADLARGVRLMAQEDAALHLRVEAQDGLVEDGLQQARLMGGDTKARADGDLFLRRRELRVKDEEACRLQGIEWAEREVGAAVGDGGEGMLVVVRLVELPAGHLLRDGMT